MKKDDPEEESRKSSSNQSKNNKNDISKAKNQSRDLNSDNELKRGAYRITFLTPRRDVKTYDEKRAEIRAQCRAEILKKYETLLAELQDKNDTPDKKKNGAGNTKNDNDRSDKSYSTSLFSPRRSSKNENEEPAPSKRYDERKDGTSNKPNVKRESNSSAESRGYSLSSLFSPRSTAQSEQDSSKDSKGRSRESENEVQGPTSLKSFAERKKEIEAQCRADVRRRHPALFGDGAPDKDEDYNKTSNNANTRTERSSLFSPRRASKSENEEPENRKSYVEQIEDIKAKYREELRKYYEAQLRKENDSDDTRSKKQKGDKGNPDTLDNKSNGRTEADSNNDPKERGYGLSSLFASRRASKSENEEPANRKSYKEQKEDIKARYREELRKHFEAQLRKDNDSKDTRSNKKKGDKGSPDTLDNKSNGRTEADSNNDSKERGYGLSSLFSSRRASKSDNEEPANRKSYEEKKEDIKAQCLAELRKRHPELFPDDTQDKDTERAGSSGSKESGSNNESKERGYGFFSSRRPSKNGNEEPATSKSSCEKLEDINAKRREELQKRYEALLRAAPSDKNKRDANNDSKCKDGTSDIRTNGKDERDANNESKERGYGFFSSRRPSKCENEEPANRKSYEEKLEEIVAKRREELQKRYEALLRDISSDKNKKDADNVGKYNDGTSDIKSKGSNESDSKNESKERGYGFFSSRRPSKSGNEEAPTSKSCDEKKEDILAKRREELQNRYEALLRDTSSDKNKKGVNNDSKCKYDTSDIRTNGKDERDANNESKERGYGFFSFGRPSKNENEEPPTPKSSAQKQEDINANCCEELRKHYESLRNGGKDSQDTPGKNGKGASADKSNGRRGSDPNNESKERGYGFFSSRRPSKNENEEASTSKGSDEKKEDIDEKYLVELRRRYEALRDADKDKNKKGISDTKSNGRRETDPNSEAKEQEYGFFSPRRTSKNENEEPAAPKSRYEKREAIIAKRREELRKRYEDLFRDEAPDTTQKDSNNVGRGKNGTSDIRSNGRDERDPNNESKERGYSFFSSRRPSKNEDEEPATSKSPDEKLEDFVAKRREELRKRYEDLLRDEASQTIKKDANNVGKGKNGTSDTRSNERDERDPNNESKERGYSSFSPRRPSQNENEKPTTSKSSYEKKVDIIEKRREELRKRYEDLLRDEASQTIQKDANNVGKGRNGTSDIRSNERDERDPNNESKERGYSSFSTRRPSQNENEKPTTSKSSYEKKVAIVEKRREELLKRYEDLLRDEAPDTTKKDANNVGRGKNGTSDIRSNGRDERDPNNESKERGYSFFSWRRPSKNEDEEPATSKSPYEKNEDINEKYREERRRRLEALRYDGKDSHDTPGKNNRGVSDNRADARDESDSNNESRGWIARLLFGRSSNNKNEEPSGSKDYDEKKKDINAKYPEERRKRYEVLLEERKVRDKYNTNKNSAINNDKDKSDTLDNQSNERDEDSKTESKGWISALLSLVGFRKPSNNNNEEPADSEDYGRNGKELDGKYDTSHYSSYRKEDRYPKDENYNKNKGRNEKDFDRKYTPSDRTKTDNQNKLNDNKYKDNDYDRNYQEPANNRKGNSSTENRTKPYDMYDASPSKKPQQNEFSSQRTSTINDNEDDFSEKERTAKEKRRETNEKRCELSKFMDPNDPFSRYETQREKKNSKKKKRDDPPKE